MLRFYQQGGQEAKAGREVIPETSPSRARPGSPSPFRAAPRVGPCTVAGWRRAGGGGAPAPFPFARAPAARRGRSGCTAPGLTPMGSG